MINLPLRIFARITGNSVFDILIMNTRLWTQKYNSTNLYSCFFFYLYPSHCLEIRLSSQDDSLLQIVDSGRNISSDLRNEIRWEKAEEWGNWFMLLCLSWGIAINWLNKTSSSQCSCFLLPATGFQELCANSSPCTFLSDRSLSY